ncbi:hypothetical protein AB0C52_13085 [Streptomyces sp. NPDC048717]|uniref:hypothetical protein n=1 Tax=Streptomyces sp. NPDC048717 TaxID=3154928 RepID=UPI00342B5317
MTTPRYVIGDVTELVKKWVKVDQAAAREEGMRPIYYSALPHGTRERMFREGHFWYQLGTGEMYDQCVPTCPTAESVTALKDRLAQCCNRLHAMADARGDLLPEGARVQLSRADHRIAMALDVVEHAPAEWSRDADAAWTELTAWAARLDLFPAAEPRRID